MAREHARIMCSIWSPGDDFRQRSPAAQRVYFVIISQREINNAGVIPLMIAKWARCSTGTTPADIETSLAELESHRYVIVDRETDELLVRTFIRGDGIVKQPNMLKSALRLAGQIESPMLRHELAQELLRIGLPETIRRAHEITDRTLPGTLPGPIADGSSTSVGHPSSDPEKNPSPSPAGWGGVGGRGRGSSSVGGRGGGNDPAPHPNLDPNNPRCSRHADVPATDPGPDCHACRAVREQLAKTAGPSSNGTHAAAPADRDAIRACSWCNPDGWRIDPAAPHRGPLSPGVRCDHTPLTDRELAELSS